MDARLKISIFCGVTVEPLTIHWRSIKYFAKGNPNQPHPKILIDFKLLSNRLGFESKSQSH